MKFKITVSCGNFESVYESTATSKTKAIDQVKRHFLKELAKEFKVENFEKMKTVSNGN